MGSWIWRGLKHLDKHLLDCLTVIYVFVAFCPGISGDDPSCPNAIVTDAKSLQIVSRQNHTRNDGEVCGEILETICFRDPKVDSCQVLLNLSVSSMAEEGKFELNLLQSKPITGKRWEISCNFTSPAEDLYSSDIVRSANFWLDYDCCDETPIQRQYYAILYVSYNKLKPCTSRGPVTLKPKGKEVKSSVNTVMRKLSENTSTEASVIGDEEDLPKKATFLIGVVVAVVIAVVAAIVTAIVIYIVCVRYRDGRFFYERTDSRSEETPLQTEHPDNCHICIMEETKVFPPDDSCSYSTLDISVIPANLTFPSSDEEPTESVLDSGFFVSM